MLMLNCIIFTIKDTKLYVPVENVSARNNQIYQNFLANDSKYQFIGMNIKQKVKIQDSTNEYRYFFKSSWS